MKIISIPFFSNNGGCVSIQKKIHKERAHWQAEYQAYKLEQETIPEAERTLKPPNAMNLKKQFNAMRQTAYPWTYEVTKCVVEGAFDDLEKAYANFFAGRAEYPKYKKKGKSHESFYVSNDKFTLSKQWIAIPGLGRFLLDQRQQRSDRGKLRRKLGAVNLAEKLRFVEQGKATAPMKQRKARKQVVCERVKVLGATVSCEAGHWYVSIQVEIKRESPQTPLAVVGVDVGVKQTAVVSDGRRTQNLRPLAHHLGKLWPRCNASSQRNRRPTIRQPSEPSSVTSMRNNGSRWHASISRSLTCAGTSNTSSAPNWRGRAGSSGSKISTSAAMMANRKLARAVADAAMGHLLQFLKTKVANAGGEQK